MKIFLYAFYFCSLLLIPNLSQAQIGILGLCEDLDMTITSSYEVEVSDLTGAGSGHDQVDIDGDLDLDGTLDILLSGYDPYKVDQLENMNYDGILTGTFASINFKLDCQYIV